MFKLKKKTLLTTLTLACMGLASTALASANIYKSTNGELHFKPSAASRSIMKAEDMNEHGYWFVPVSQAKAMNFTPTPVHKVLGITEDEYTTYCMGEAGHGGAPWHKFTGVVVPVNEILDLTEEEYLIYSQGEGGQMPNRFIHPGEMYNPKTWNNKSKNSL